MQFLAQTSPCSSENQGSSACGVRRWLRDRAGRQRSRNAPGRAGSRVPRLAGGCVLGRANNHAAAAHRQPRAQNQERVAVRRICRAGSRALRAGAEPSAACRSETERREDLLGEWRMQQ
jgi:hypothetical protein